MSLNRIENALFLLTESQNFDADIEKGNEPNEWHYKGKRFTKNRMGHYEFYSDDHQRFLKADSLDGIKNLIDQESIEEDMIDECDESKDMGDSEMVNEINLDENDEFEPHGYYTVSNTGGYLIQISDDGDGARVKEPTSGEVSEWFEIEYVENEDGESEPVIDPYPEGEDSGHYNIPLNMVMKFQR